MNILIYVLIELIAATVILWKTAFAMIEEKRILKFIPFFIAGIAISLDSAFALHEIYLSLPWLIIEIEYIVAILTVLIVLARGKGK
ncbi:MAG: hypothetical protein PHQ66_01650 [Candidatus Nanoarchaeia archaeon]|nr:hypothetical protein [Candidatus Nanoarchaeia archaeon]MDD5357920.1 hypothetical protein [Candidatus Nanoarchaeia archaeon]MDD5588839.1 hypothetical protein [Candidatus Nanoarchaeia archaeon]